MIPAESVGLPLPHIAFVGTVSDLIARSMFHVATRTVPAIAVLVWQSVGGGSPLTPSSS